MSSAEVLSREFVGCRRLLMKLVSKVVPHKDVEDVVQEAYLKACQAEYEVYQPRSFLVKVARNLALDHVKRAENRYCDSLDDDAIELLDSLSNGEDVTLSESISNERFMYFCEALKELPGQCRKVFILKKVYGYSQKEISKELNISESAVEKHVAAGIRRCRHYMNALEGNDNKSSLMSRQSGGRI